MKTNETTVSSIPIILRNLMYEKGINQKQLAKAVGVTDALISAYMKGRRFPSSKTIKKLSEYFNISPSEFFPIEEPKIESISFETRRNQYFSGKLEHLITINGMTQKEFASKIGVSRQTANYYVNSTCFPKNEILMAICKLFDVDKSYFIMSEEKMNIVFYVDKVPMIAEQCPFMREIKVEKDGELCFMCSYGGKCEIKDGECTHLKEVPFNRAVAN